MDFLLILVAITVVQIPGLILRYLPYSNVLSSRDKKRLLQWYVLGLICQIMVVLLITKGHSSGMTPLTYKRLLFILSTIYVGINIYIIKGSVYKHIFIYGMQGGYSLFIHSIVALIVHHYSDYLSLSHEIVLQTTGYMLLFGIFFIPFWKKLKNSIIFNSALTDSYYWNTIWMIPALAIYSDAMVTMNHEWINSFPQVLSRIMTAASLIISWKWITLDFQSLENMLHLKNTNQVLHMQTEALLSQSRILNEAENKMRVYKHDMRHQLGILTSLLVHNNQEKALQLIETLNNQMMMPLPVVYCRNTMIQSALSIYLAKAQDYEIPVSVQFDVPEFLPWEESDLAILIANAFENAINASVAQPSREQKIELSARYHAQQLAIVVKNKFYGDVQFSKEGFPVTDRPNHGTGVHSMLSIINKYNGHAKCSYKDDWFEWTFLLVE